MRWFYKGRTEHYIGGVSTKWGGLCIGGVASTIQRALYRGWVASAIWCGFRYVGYSMGRHYAGGGNIGGW